MLRTRTATVVAASALAAGVATGAAGYAALSGNGSSPTASSATQSPAASSASRTTIGAIYDQANESVVEITVTSQTSTGPDESPFPFGGVPQKQTQQAQGSGFVYDNEGHIVTNDHVVQGATAVKVTFADGSTHEATVVGTDPSTDLAVLKVDAAAGKLHPLTLANSDDVAVGDGVVAIGSPCGLAGTLTTGVVSALDRTIDGTNGYSIPGAIQTDAAINHGNSGGVLLNMRGEVIGVTSQIESESGGNVGIGFAIPSSTARTVASELIGHGRAEHPWLGVEIETIAPGVARVVRGLPSHGVVVLRVVKGGPAATAAIVASTRQVTVGGVTAFTGGDSIVAVDGKRVTSSGQLSDLLAPLAPGDHVKLRVARGSATRTVDVTLGNVPG